MTRARLGAFLVFLVIAFASLACSDSSTTTSPQATPAEPIASPQTTAPTPARQQASRETSAPAPTEDPTGEAAVLQTVVPTATPFPTLNIPYLPQTPIPLHTPAPERGVTRIPNLEPAPTPVPTRPRTPKPTPLPAFSRQGETLELGPGTQDIRPELWGVMYKYAEGKYVEQRSLRLLITESGESQSSQSLHDFISSVKGQKMDVPGGWYVPTEYVTQVVQRRETKAIDWQVPTGETFFMTSIIVGEYAEEPLYERDDVLIRVIRARYAGVPDAEAAKYAFLADGDRILVSADAGDARALKQIRVWLFARGIYSIPPHPIKRPNDYTIVAIVPVSELHSLMETFDRVRFEANDIRDYSLPISRAWWSDDTVQNEKGVLARTIGILGQYTTLLIDEHGLMDRQAAVRAALAKDFAQNRELENYSETTKGGAMTLLETSLTLHSNPSIGVPRNLDEDQLVWLVVFEGEIDEKKREEGDILTLRPEQLVMILDARTGETVQGFTAGGYHGVNTEGLEDLTSYFEASYAPKPTPTPLSLPTPDKALPLQPQEWRTWKEDVFGGWDSNLGYDLISAVRATGHSNDRADVQLRAVCFADLISRDTGETSWPLRFGLYVDETYHKRGDAEAAGIYDAGYLSVLIAHDGDEIWRGDWIVQGSEQFFHPYTLLRTAFHPDREVTNRLARELAHRNDGFVSISLSGEGSEGETINRVYWFHLNGAKEAIARTLETCTN